MITPPSRRVVVRRAEASDEDAVWPLVEAFASTATPTRTAFAATFPGLLDRDDVLVLVAVAGCEGTEGAAGTKGTEGAAGSGSTGDRGLVGYLLAQLQPTFFADGPVAWVQEVMVRADVRRAGVGGSLLGAAERWATERGAVYTSLASRRAGDFYRALGYEESATFFKRPRRGDGLVTR